MERHQRQSDLQTNKRRLSLDDDQFRRIRRSDFQVSAELRAGHEAGKGGLGGKS